MQLVNRDLIDHITKFTRPIVSISKVIRQIDTILLTAAQVTAFFERSNQMAMPRAKRVQLQSERITDPSNLVEPS